MTVIELTEARADRQGDFELRGIDLRLAAGEILAIAGPNGAGKSSLLRLLAGDLTLAGGGYRFLCRDFGSWQILPRARRLAMLGQHSPLRFPFTAAEVIALGRLPHSLPRRLPDGGRRTDRQVIGEVMTATATTPLAHRVYTELSGGEKQRVQIARVLAQVWEPQTADVSESQPRLLLLDEPLAPLDLAHQALVRDALETLAANGCAIVVAGHDFNALTALADRLLILNRGRVAAEGSPAAVLIPELFAEVFGARVAVVPHPSDGRPLAVPL